MAVETFIDFYKRYYRLVLTVAQQRLVGHGGAEDVTAEVFRIAWSHHQSGGELSLPWVYKTLRNVVGNEYRRLSRRPEFEDLEMAYSAATVPMQSVDDDVDIRSVMMELSLAERELLFMAYWEDLTRAEIAEILGCSEGAVRVRLLRARKNLSARLELAEHTLVRRGER